MKFAPILLAMSALLLGASEQSARQAVSANDLPTQTDWPAYGGSPAGSRYSPLTQINLGNADNLKLAWTFDTGENQGPDGGMDIQCQPTVVRGVMYGTTPRLKLFAVDAATGQRRWLFDPFANGRSPRFHPMRGVVYWEEGDDQRVLYTVGPTLYAVDARTGKPVPNFGTNGEVDLHEGLGGPATLGYDVTKFSIRSTTPGVIYRDLLILGSSVSEGGDALPGHIRAFNVRTGKLAWVFHTIPQPGEYGYDTWAKDSYRKIGGANCWAGLVVDEKRGIAFVGTGSPSVDFYGGARPGQNLFANCVLALNARTGKRLWHFQTVHHDLWDRDLPCPPNLLTVTHNGKKVDAVAQATKDGYVFVFDRETGKPLFPVKEVPVPTSPALPGEKPWPTQPVPSKPAPFALQEVTEATLTDRTPEAQAYVLDRYRNSRHLGKYTPPSEQGTLYLGFGGGAEWGGAAADPDGIFYVNGNNMLWWLKMRPNQAGIDGAQGLGARLFNTNCSVCHGLGGEAKTSSAAAQAYPDLTNVGKRLSREQMQSILTTGKGRMPSFGHLPQKDRDALVDFLLNLTAKSSAADDVHATKKTVTAKGESFPYQPPFLNNGTTQFRDPNNYPAVKPPWGTLNAINLNTGEYVWRVPLGEYPELVKRGLTNTGTENHGGPLVTAGGLLFIAATYDEKLRAFDKKTGKVVWETKLPAGGFATPITYQVNGRQYVAIACGGTRYGLKSGGSYVAFALPEASR